MLIYANRGHDWATQGSLQLTEKLITVHINVAALPLSINFHWCDYHVSCACHRISYDQCLQFLSM